MSDVITVIAKSRLSGGRLEELKLLIAELVAHMKATEPGCLSYDWFIDDGGEELMVIERYEDSDAVLFHAQNYQSYVPRLDECRQPLEITINGNVSDKLAAAMSSMSLGGSKFVAGL